MTDKFIRSYVSIDSTNSASIKFDEYLMEDGQYFVLKSLFECFGFDHYHLFNGNRKKMGNKISIEIEHCTTTTKHYSAAIITSEIRI